MKKVLITGANSYIGKNVKSFLSQWPDDYYVESVGMVDGAWKDKDFSVFDVIFHTAGIAHIKETKENEKLYYEVNEQLATSVAEKAKSDGVKQFIILSTMSVYGVNSGHINKDTLPKPINNYGKTKYNADLKLMDINCDSFKVAILRPPMVYGKDCKGNYQTLRKFALKFKLFPNYRNERSMIFVGNLAAFVKKIIDESASGIYFPQDENYVCTADMVEYISKISNKKVVFTKIFNLGVAIALKLNINVFKKVFGSLTYEKTDIVNYYSFDEAMRLTEGE